MPQIKRLQIFHVRNSLLSSQSSLSSLHGREGLKSQRHNIDGWSGNVQKAAIVDPEGDHDTSDDEELVEGWKVKSDGSY